MATAKTTREERAAARASWPIRRFELEARTGDDISASTTAQERLEMMWDLARRAWLLAGRDLPQYDRANMPGRIIRRGS